MTKFDPFEIPELASGNRGQFSRDHVLAIGDPEEWLPTGYRPPSGIRDLAYCEFAELDARSFARLEIELVFSPLLAHSFDCVDIARTLVRCRFGGSYKVVFRDLPKPEMVRREMRALYPDLAFEMISVG